MTACVLVVVSAKQKFEQSCHKLFQQIAQFLTSFLFHDIVDTKYFPVRCL